jgi:hypothetical protein
VFTLGEQRPTELRLNLNAYLVPGKLTSQRVGVSLNGQMLANFTISDPSAQVQSIVLPPESLRDENVLMLELPDAEAPQKLGAEPDPRPRGIKLNWIEFGARCQMLDVRC